MQRLKSSGVWDGGRLTLTNMDGVAHEFEAELLCVLADYDAMLRDYLRATHNQGVPDKERRGTKLMGRLIVETFADMFGTESEVNRRVLPGFFEAMKMMLGTEKIDDFEGRARMAAELLRDTHEGEFTWAQFYADERAQDLLLEILMEIVEYFEDPVRRRAWMVEVINTHLGPPEGAQNAEAFGAGSRNHTRGHDLDVEAEMAARDKLWQFSPEPCGKVLNAMFDRLKATVSSEQGRAQITRRYGATTCLHTMEILKRIDNMAVDPTRP